MMTILRRLQKTVEVVANISSVKEGLAVMASLVHVRPSTNLIGG